MDAQLGGGFSPVGMEHLCTCPEHGYSQPGRYGTSGCCEVATDAGVIKVRCGDRDCSSAVCEAWELALKGTSHEGEITRYHTTYDMRNLFLSTGLFSWENMAFMACRGDIYLDESAHTAMCLQNDASADVLGEFSISETGGIDGEPGDQTGWESSVHGYYEAWDGILHYLGGADGGEVSPSAPSGGSSSGNLPMPRYRVAVMLDGKKTWLDWMEGLYCTDGCGDTFAGIEGIGIVDSRDRRGEHWRRLVREEPRRRQADRADRLLQHAGPRGHGLLRGILSLSLDGAEPRLGQVGDRR